MFKVNKDIWVKIINSKISYSEAEPDFSNFVINLASSFDPIFSSSKSESDDSACDLNSVFTNLYIFSVYESAYIYTLLGKLVDDFFYQSS